jgi:hypothetical protein
MLTRIPQSKCCNRIAYLVAVPDGEEKNITICKTFYECSECKIKCELIEGK